MSLVIKFKSASFPGLVRSLRRLRISEYARQWRGGHHMSMLDFLTLSCLWTLVWPPEWSVNILIKRRLCRAQLCLQRSSCSQHTQARPTEQSQLVSSSSLFSCMIRVILVTLFFISSSLLTSECITDLLVWWLILNDCKFITTSGLCFQPGKQDQTKVAAGAQDIHVHLIPDWHEALSCITLRHCCLHDADERNWSL